MLRYALLAGQKTDMIIGYELADYTVHPLPLPPKKTRSKMCSFVLHGCLVPPEIFYNEKVDYVGDI